VIKRCWFFILWIAGSLYADPTLMQISEYPRIFMISKFLSDEECEHMIQVARPHLIASKVVDENHKGEAVDHRRTSRGFFVHNQWNDPIIIGIEKRIAAILCMPRENGEDLHVLHYGMGEEYQPHYDYFNAATPGGSECMRRGGQRIASLIMYLHAPDAGGETIFPRPNILITPRKGDAVLFYNCTPNGIVDPHSLHGGAPVKAGEKWIMTKWIRERAFQ